MPRVTVLSGFSARATRAATDELLTADRSLVVIRHDLSALAEGRFRSHDSTPEPLRAFAGTALTRDAGDAHEPVAFTRFVCTANEVLESETVELVHGCLSCSLREDVLPTLVRLARSRPDADQLLVLPDIVEPEQIASAFVAGVIDGRRLPDWLRLGAFVTAIDGETFLADVTGEDDLADRGPDDRAVCGVILRQLEFSDVVLADAAVFDLLEALAPWTSRRPMHEAASVLAGPDRDLETPTAALRGLEGLPVALAGSLHFTARRPFHPGRLDAALPALIEHTVRGRGHLWLATQPDTVIAYESHGCGVSMGAAGLWLAAADADWSQASPGRRTAASLGWDERFGDRGIELVFVDFGGCDRARLRAVLTACLLTDEELALGQDAWLGFPDPFAGSFV